VSHHVSVMNYARRAFLVFIKTRNELLAGVPIFRLLVRLAAVATLRFITKGFGGGSSDPGEAEVGTVQNLSTCWPP
jgi:hypothetical protein